MMFTFNTVLVNDDYRLIEKRNLIAINYLTGWFTIDLMAILPVDLLKNFFIESEEEISEMNQQVLENGSDIELVKYNGIIRIIRIGRIYKLMKLARLFRIIKIFKSKMIQMFRKANSELNISDSFEKLIIFIMISFLIVHIVACMWVFATTFSDEDEPTWIRASEISKNTTSSKYLYSIYFTVTTITTVGYGDILATNMLEQAFCIACMLIGVIGFTLFTSTLTKLLSEYEESSNKILNDKVDILNTIYKEYYLPLDIYERVKKSLVEIYKHDVDELNDFLSVLPLGLSVEMSFIINEQFYS